MPFTKGHPNYLFTHTPEVREKLRLSKLGNKNPRFGKTPWNKGKPHLVGNKNPAWKNDNELTKESIHSWVRNHFIKSGVCEHCQLPKKTEWSNKDHKYKSRNRDTWQELCRSCHQLYDFKFLKRTKRGKDIKKRIRRFAVNPSQNYSAPTPPSTTI